MLRDDESWKAMVSFCETVMSQKEADEQRREEATDVASSQNSLEIEQMDVETAFLIQRYYKNDKVDIMDCYVDADWAGDIVDRKSTTGYCIRLFGNVVYWKSKKQNCVTKSSTFAEYIALSEAVNEINLLINICNDVFVKICNPVKIYEDNSGALSIAKYGNFTKNSKHIEVNYYYVHESYKNGIIEIVKIDTNNNVADIFTKSLGNVKFIKFRELLNLKK
ncbi:unnamed protein product [Euphydryas editha]|uniref:Mitochondrial protein n=1 Tax=Euphydryas editha TaxID=104508 RepID=A0AAU9TZV5_EUPED|nr:unnamed protein product [Euphydryas editha]